MPTDEERKKQIEMEKKLRFVNALLGAVQGMEASPERKKAQEAGQPYYPYGLKEEDIQTQLYNEVVPKMLREVLVEQGLEQYVAQVDPLTATAKAFEEIGQMVPEDVRLGGTYSPEEIPPATSPYMNILRYLSPEEIRAGLTIAVADPEFQAWLPNYIAKRETERKAAREEPLEPQPPVHERPYGEGTLDLENLPTTELPKAGIGGKEETIAPKEKETWGIGEPIMKGSASSAAEQRRLWGEAEKCKATGDYQEASRLYRQAYEIDPKSVYGKKAQAAYHELQKQF